METLALFLMLIEKVKQLKEIREDRKAAAIAALRAALILTEQHYAGQTQPNAVLAQHWSNAAEALKDVDAEIAVILDRKSKYWNDPAGWHRIAKTGRSIQLDHIRLLLNLLANPKG